MLERQCGVMRRHGPLCCSTRLGCAGEAGEEADGGSSRREVGHMLWRGCGRLGLCAAGGRGRALFCLWLPPDGLCGLGGLTTRHSIRSQCLCVPTIHVAGKGSSSLSSRRALSHLFGLAGTEVGALEGSVEEAAAGSSASWAASNAAVKALLRPSSGSSLVTLFT